ncbi:hypothetical protein BDD12DRAFT_805201 [Trichophaea hybrida]|nr:hypothetical protein BDD12DRAFT_805201 [Trichophaea hybrida]
MSRIAMRKNEKTRMIPIQEESMKQRRWNRFPLQLVRLPGPPWVLASSAARGDTRATAEVADTEVADMEVADMEEVDTYLTSDNRLEFATIVTRKRSPDGGNRVDTSSTYFFVPGILGYFHAFSGVGVGGGVNYAALGLGDGDDADDSDDDQDAEQAMGKYLSYAGVWSALMAC